MSNEEGRAKIEVDGDATGWKRTMREVQDSLNKGAREVEDRFGKVGEIFEGVQGKLVALAAVVGGGRIFGEAVEETEKYIKEAINLGRALGIPASEASVLLGTLEDIDVPVDEFASAATKLSKNLRENEAALNKVGLVTRDAAGNLRPLNELTVDAVSVLRQYKEGTDRTIAGQVLFGKGFEITGNLIELNTHAVEENREAMDALGMIVGDRNVAAWSAFDSASDGVSRTMKAIWITIGKALLPVLTDLGNWFSSIGPYAVVALRGAIGGLVAVFEGLTTTVTIAWETINAMVVTVAEPIRALGEAIYRALQGDWQGAKDAIRGIGNVISTTWEKAGDEIIAKATKTRERLIGLFAKPESSSSASPDGGQLSAAGLVKAPATKQGPRTRMPEYEAELAALKAKAAEENALREYSKQEELAYWETLRKAGNLYAADALAIRKKVSDLTVAIRRADAQEQMALDVEAQRSQEALALGEIEMRRTTSRVALDLDQVTKQTFLQAEAQFELERFAVQRKGLEDRLKLLEADPNTNPVEYARLKNQILQLEQQHQVRMMQLAGETKAEQLTYWTSLKDRFSNLWDDGVNAMMNGTLRWRNALRAVGAQMSAWFVQDVVGKKVKAWLLGEASQTAATAGGTASRLALESAAALKSLALSAMTSIKKIGHYAYEAMAGAFKAAMALPYPANIAAAGAGVALAGATVFGLASAVSSAEGGFDIPRGLNPMTQLHQEEMVLPAHIANPLRSMIDQHRSTGSGGAAPGLPSITIHAMDSRDVQRALRQGGALDRALRDAHRRFAHRSPT